MAITRFDAVTDALVSVVSGAVGDGVTVWDGTPVTGDPLEDAVIIGGRLPDDTNAPTAAVSQEYRSIGGASALRDEEGRIACMAVAQRGSGMSAARAACIATLGAVESAVRADPTLGGVDSLIHAEVVDVEVMQVQHKAGVSVLADFTVKYRAVI